MVLLLRDDMRVRQDHFANIGALILITFMIQQLCIIPCLIHCGKWQIKRF